MYEKSFSVCPHLKGGMNGAICAIANDFIKDMLDADIHVCMYQDRDCSVFHRCAKITCDSVEKQDSSLRSE